MNRLALAVLLIGAGRHYLWDKFPAELQGMASKGMGACAILALAVLLYRAAPSRSLLAVLAWLAFEELQVILCSALYMAGPWDVPPGVGICSAVVGLDLGAVGILMVAWLVHTLSGLTGTNAEGTRAK